MEEIVARALCTAEGLDPNEIVSAGGAEPVAVDGSVVVAPTEQPQWQRFVKEARKFIAAHQAIASSNAASFPDRQGITRGQAEANVEAIT